MICGLKIPPERFKRELVVSKGILTEEEYTQLLLQIYGSEDLAKWMIPVNDSLKYIPHLKKEGHKLKVVTSRHNRQLEIAEEWIGQNLSGLELVGGG